MFRPDPSQFVDALPRTLELGVVIPTFNEAENIRPLLGKLEAALRGIRWEAIFVDDGSRDGTVETLLDIAAADGRVRVIRRVGRRGLSTAVVEGMLASAAPVLAVIDADLQHDETILPQLHAAVADGDADIAVGTRYTAGGSITDWDASRAFISRAATRVAGLALRTEVSDPMSGFFAIRREALTAALPRLSGVGYKILLDLVASTPVPARIREVPYSFRRRTAGESKLDSTVALEYGLLLLDKTVGRFLPVRMLMFFAVGLLGLGVHLGLLRGWLATGLAFGTAQAIAVVGSMTVNFVLNNRLTYRDRRLRGFAFWRGLASFYAICSLGAAANVGVGSLIYDSDARWWFAGAVGALVGAAWNYAATSAVTWKAR